MRQLAWVLLLAGLSPLCVGHAAPTDRLELATRNSAGFVAAHGEQALLMGYSAEGLEAWAYPFQLFRNYHVSFTPAGTDTVVDGNATLSRIICRPTEIVRIYVGPDFEVREHLFVPLHQPGVVIRYQVEGRKPVDIRVTFLPVLNLMWPAALGGQDLRWDENLSAYDISEITTGYRALIGSPQQVAHSAVVNSTLRRDLTQSIVMHPSNGRAELIAALEHSPEAEGSQLKFLESRDSSLLAEAQAQSEELLNHGLQIRTPDETLNRAMMWSQIALDQAWVCNPQLGCGLVAGYGPSRGMRRPQYAWFFAGDGLIATEALLAEGHFARAKEELEFILKYQNHANGMIWHEVSQSAGFIDWAGKYPYMYVHVDITFAFLSTLANYYDATGDLHFLRSHWDQVAAAYRYCRATVNSATALPQIPLGKEGGNEQERMREDVGLSAAWIATSEAYRQIAEATGHTAEAADAARAGAAARAAFARRYWDPEKHFWIAGYSETGRVMTDERAHPGLLGQGLFTPEQEDAALDRIASADFQTDWGTRGMAADSPHFDPDSYASGSVSALATAATAEAFWKDHRPALALAIWESLLPWNHLDSLGHLHEVAAGDFFHPQVESVPEQIWSSAGLLSAAVHGLFGIDVDAPEHRLRLEPHLDPLWSRVSLAQIAVGDSKVRADLEQKPGEIGGTFSLQGSTVHLSFAPQIPLGATAVRALVNGKRVPVAIEEHEEDQHARVEATLNRPEVHCQIHYSGGVRILAPAPEPAVGEGTHQLKITEISLRAHQLSIEADVASPDAGSVDIETPWQIEGIDGGTAEPSGGGWYKLRFVEAPAQQNARYVHRRMTVHFRVR